MRGSRNRKVNLPLPSLHGVSLKIKLQFLSEFFPNVFKYAVRGRIFKCFSFKYGWESTTATKLLF